MSNRFCVVSARGTHDPSPDRQYTRPFIVSIMYKNRARVCRSSQTRRQDTGTKTQKPELSTHNISISFRALPYLIYGLIRCTPLHTSARPRGTCNLSASYYTCLKVPTTKYTSSPTWSSPPECRELPRRALACSSFSGSGLGLGSGSGLRNRTGARAAFSLRTCGLR